MKSKPERPTVRLKPSEYQPTKAGKEEVYVPPADMTPAKLVKRMFGQTKIVRDPAA